MKRQVIPGLCLLLALMTLLGACARQSSPTPLPMSPVPTASPTAVPTALATVLPSTAVPTAMPPTSTPTSPSPSSTPTSTAAPQPSPTAEATRIEFASGMTSATLSGELPANAVAGYVLRAQAGQLMEVSVTPQQGIQLSIQAANGTMLKSAAGTPFFRGILPATGDYAITLTGGNQAVAYTLSVIIPIRISFAAGATSGLVEGELPAHSSQYYVLGAQANQLMEVDVTPQEQLQLVIYGADGTVLKSGMGDVAFFRGTLPSTQDYILVLATGDEAVSYIMSVVIPKRIQFAPGAISAVEEGEAGPGQEQTYVLAASGGQTMQVDVVAPGADVRLVIYGQDGTVLKSGMGGGSTFEGILPSTQDYLVVVGPADRSTHYQLEVTIQ
jgi:hypothetical protein